MEGQPNNNQIRRTKSIIQYNISSDDKDSVNLYSTSLLNDKIGAYYIDKDKQLKNKPENKLKKLIEKNLTPDNQLNDISSEKMKKSTVFVKKFQNNYKDHDWKLNQKIQNKERNLTLNSQSSSLVISSIKYRMIRTPGCRRPIFMFIRRGS